jgi:hypothetical protein
MRVKYARWGAPGFEKTSWPLDQEAMAVVIAGRRAARVVLGDEIGVLVGLGLRRLVVNLDRGVVQVAVAGEDAGRVLEGVVAVDHALQREAIGHDVGRAPAARLRVGHSAEDLGDGNRRRDEHRCSSSGPNEDSTHVPSLS